jgi:hypothetical protein
LDAVQTLQEYAPNALGSVWKNLRGTDVLLTEQARRSRERDAMFEVLVASIVAPLGEMLELRGSENPDVFFTYMGVPIGFECKAMYGQARRDSVRAAVKDKLKQLTQRNPDLQHGFVALDLTATYSGHGLDSFQLTGDEARARLQHHVLSIKRAALSDPDLCARIRNAAPKCIEVWFMAQSACLAVDRTTFVQVLHKVAPGHLSTVASCESIRPF